MHSTKAKVGRVLLQYEERLESWSCWDVSDRTNGIVLNVNLDQNSSIADNMYELGVRIDDGIISLSACKLTS